ncbi:protein of unknown function [Methylocaldum szegediense]|uniref:Uncharacterized protein n=1 Tax=Methylocaldum szegediense TaxID=73780 RepID=A0ABN8X2S7_9GAMM|nr:protein of unknown function [Methylocaldum szegediense]
MGKCVKVAISAPYRAFDFENNTRGIRPGLEFRIPTQSAIRS